MTVFFFVLPNPNSLWTITGVLATDAALKELYESSRLRIYSFLRKFSTDLDAVEDLTQETFSKFLAYYGQKELTKDESISLLYRIARNLSINYQGKRNTAKETELHDSAEKPEILFPKKLEQKDTENQLRSLLNHLPEEERTAVIMKFLHDSPLKEIASALEVSIPTASRVVARGTEKLIRLAKEKRVFE